MRDFLLKCFVAITVCLGFTVASVAAIATWVHEQSDLPPDPAVTWGLLENGFRYVLMPNAEPPDRVSLRLYIHAGSLMEEDDQRGLAHFLEHMAFNGSRNFPEGDMVEYFQRIGMSFGADTNAHTGFDETVYKLELPHNDLAVLKDGLRLFRDYADGLLLSIEEIDKERGVVLSEMRTRDSVAYRIFEEEIKFLLPASPIPKRLPIGEKSVIESAPRERLLDFYKKWYTANRMVLVVVGAVDAVTLVPLIKKFFNDLEPVETPLPDPDLGEVITMGITTKLHREPEASATTIALQVIQPYHAQPDTRTKRVADLYRSVAYRILSRRLEILAKKEEAPFAHGTAYAYDWFDFVQNASIELTCQPEQWKEALHTAEQELRRALTYGFTQAELDEIKNKFLNDYEQAAKSAPSRQSRHLSSAIVHHISEKKVFTSPQDELKYVRFALERLTPEMCLEALRKSWVETEVFIFLSGNLQLEEPASTILAAYQASQTKTLAPPVEEKQQSFAYKIFGKPTAIISQQYWEDLEVTQITFSNNVCLNLKPTDFERNTIYVTARFGGGRMTTPKGKPGLALLASNTFVEGGLVEHSVDELERIFAGKTVGVNFEVSDDAFTLSGETTPEHLESQFQLMSAYLIAPGYREEALRQAQKNFVKLYLQLYHTPQGVLKNEVAHFLASGDYRFGFPDREILRAHTLEEVRAWLREPLRSSYMEVSLVGDFEVEQAIALARATFGSLPNRKNEKPSFKEARVLYFPAPSMEKIFSFRSEIPKAIAAVYWSTVDIWEIGRVRRLNLLSEVFSDRLRVKIREQMGEAYSPHAIHRPSDTYTDYGYLTAFIMADPGQARKLAALGREIGLELCQNGVAQDELDRALKPMLSSLKELLRNNRYWLKTVLQSSQEYPQHLDWARHRLKDYNSITVEEINRMAKKYLVDKKAVTVLVLPQNGDISE